MGAEDIRCSSSVDARPRRIVVLDGGWRECKRMNDWVDPNIRRVSISTATREEYGGTRKYGSDGGGGRVQTAAAFVALLQELGEDPAHVVAFKNSLAHFLAAWESQICRSKTFVK